MVLSSYISLTLDLFTWICSCSTFLMEKEIITQLAEFSLQDEENIPISFEECDIWEGIEECKRSCYGRFYANKEINFKGLRWAMTKAWKSEKIQISKLHDQILHIFFPTKEEANRIVDQGPWCFDKDLLIVKPWRYGEAIKVEDFYHTPFWIHIKGLPLECYTQDMVQKIGKNFSGCSVIQIRENLDNGGRFFCMRATVNILKPQGIP